MGRGRMGPRGFGGFCLALLCSGAALGFQEEESGNGNVTEEIPEGTRDPLEPPGHPSTATGDGDAVTAWSSVTTSPPRSLGDLAVTPAGNQTRASSGVPARYWSPVIFVVLALLVLFVTYQRTKDKGIQDRATSGSDSSDLGALVQPQVRDPIPKIPEHTETALDQPDPPQPLSRFHSPGKVGNGFLDSGRCREPELDAKEEEENSHFLILG
ncbi:uncharacterized protein [Anomalospiza imberbis]|uniref:uncharacterized protein isoform X2 n=1 Tax=Anomalospiza imberbis TaxID=187417 RepID=UPI00358E41FD